NNRERGLGDMLWPMSITPPMPSALWTVSPRENSSRPTNLQGFQSGNRGETENFRALLSGEHAITGFSNLDIRKKPAGSPYHTDKRFMLSLDVSSPVDVKGSLYLGPDMDKEKIGQALRHLRGADPIMRNVIERAGPFRLKLRRNRFHALVSSILSQQISGKAAA